MATGTTQRLNREEKKLLLASAGAAVLVTSVLIGILYACAVAARTAPIQANATIRPSLKIPAIFK